MCAITNIHIIFAPVLVKGCQISAEIIPNEPRTGNAV